MRGKAKASLILAIDSIRRMGCAAAGISASNRQQQPQPGKRDQTARCAPPRIAYFDPSPGVAVPYSSCA